MISTGEIRKGVVFELDGQPVKVLDWTHIKMARGSAQVRLKIQNVRTGAITERTFQAGTRWPRGRVEQRRVQYLYADGDAYHFMDTETYDQPTLNRSTLEDVADYLIEGLEAKLTFYQDEPIDIELPTAVDLKVTEADAGVKGDTATGATKTVTTETGLRVQVPLFVQSGDKIRVDTRSGQYLTRV